MSVPFTKQSLMIEARVMAQRADIADGIAQGQTFGMERDLHRVADAYRTLSEAMMILANNGITKDAPP